MFGLSLMIHGMNVINENARHFRYGKMAGSAAKSCAINLRRNQQDGSIRRRESKHGICDPK
jgi:hypothetical protein